jgi:altronate hydrolase
VIDGDATLDEMGDEIFRRFLEIASGRKSKSEILGVGEEEFAPWPIGVTG